MGVTWFARAGDIPGLSYEAPVAVDRTALRGYDSVPEVETRESFLDEGEMVETVFWRDAAGGWRSSTASPAKELAGSLHDQDLTVPQRLELLWQVLELPGGPRDYHFAIAAVMGALWSDRRSNPRWFPWIDWLCQLDIRLVEACPDSVRDEYATDYPEGREYYSIPAFSTLIGLRLHEGLLAEARAVAARGARFGQSSEDLDERLVALREEDGPE